MSNDVGLDGGTPMRQVWVRSSVGIRSFAWRGFVCGTTDCISIHERRTDEYEREIPRRANVQGSLLYIDYLRHGDLTCLLRRSVQVGG